MAQFAGCKIEGLKKHARVLFGVDAENHLADSRGGFPAPRRSHAQHHLTSEHMLVQHKKPEEKETSALD